MSCIARVFAAGPAFAVGDSVVVVAAAEEHHSGGYVSVTLVTDPDPWWRSTAIARIIAVIAAVTGITGVHVGVTIMGVASGAVT